MALQTVAAVPARYPALWLTRLLALMALFLTCVAPAGAELRVFELSHASPESLVPVIEPLLGPYESVSAHQRSLVVNAGEGALERIAQMLRELDVPPRNLQISLRRGDPIPSGGQPRSGSMHIGTGVAGSRAIDPSEGHSSTRPKHDEQSVRALEGSTVLISDGRLVPLVQGSIFGPGIGYEHLQQGFAVSARVSGETVSLELDARNEHTDGGEVRTGSLHSRVSGRLGEWIALGSATGSQVEAASESGRHLATRPVREQQYEVRVELLPP